MSDVELLRTSFEAVTPQAQHLLDRFYAILFERYPAVRPLFAQVEMKKQQGKLLASLALVVKNCDQPEKLLEPLRQMGARHINYGTLPEHYPAVGECLLAALAEVAGPLWTPELEGAWTRAYQVVASVMLEGARVGVV
ncbi:flavohemoprotein [bacterium]|nr:flavohemoprotein [bacterium]